MRAGIFSGLRHRPCTEAEGAKAEPLAVWLAVLQGAP